MSHNDCRASQDLQMVSHNVYAKIDGFGDTELTRRVKFSSEKKEKFYLNLLDYALLFLCVLFLQECVIFGGTQLLDLAFCKNEKAIAYALFEILQD